MTRGRRCVSDSMKFVWKSGDASMFRFLKKYERLRPWESFEPCIGVVDTHGEDDAKALLRCRDMLLRVVCRDDVGRVERGLAMGSRRLGIYVRYDVWCDFYRRNLGFNGSVDIAYPYDGWYAYYSRKEVRAELAMMTPTDIRPYGLSDRHVVRILGEACGKCWLCGRDVSECGPLSVQEMLPWNHPFLSVLGTVHESHLYPCDEWTIFCKPLCGECLRIWRVAFDDVMGEDANSWLLANGITDPDRFVMSGGLRDGPEQMEMFRKAVAACCEERRSRAD